MRLRSLEIAQFRKFDRPTRLDGFTDGLNMLCGPNEFGKSTILAAIRALMFERHASRATAIKSMQPWRGNAAPELAMEFDIDGAPWRIEKRFISQPMARLTGPDGARFDNEAAEEALQRLLGFGAAGKQGASTDTMGVWGALWVTQRDSVDQPDVSQGLARSTITGCLDTEVGVLTGQEAGHAIIAKVREQRSQLLDGNSKPRGRLRDAVRELAACEADLDSLRLRASRLAEDSEALRRDEAKLALERDPEAEARDHAALNAARAAREAALVHAASQKTASLAVEQAQAAVQDAEAARSRRLTLGRARAQAEAALHTAAGAVALAQGELETVREHYAAQAARLEAAETALENTRRARQAASLLAEAARRAAPLPGLREALAEAEAAQARLTTLDARLAGIAATAETLAPARRHAQALALVQARQQAQATRLHFALAPGAGAQITLNGAPAAPDGVHLVTRETTIGLGTLGALTITPGLGEGPALDRALEEARDALAAALRATGCASLAAAEAALAEREALQRARDDAATALLRAAPGDRARKLASGAAALRAHVAALEAQAQEDAARLGALPETADAEAAASAAEAASSVAEQDLQAARAQRDAAAAVFHAAQQRAQAGIAAQAGAAADATRLAAEAEREFAREDDAALAQRLVLAQARAAAAQQELSAIDAQRPAESADMLAARVQRYEQALRQRQDNIRRLQESLAGLRARITLEGGAGLGEQIASEERRQEALATERAGLEQEAAILTLLLETLLAAERETKERYRAPVIRRVAPHLQRLFPGAAIECTDELRISNVTREAGEEDFARLSIGTQEQIAVLTRLAFADMLRDQGKPAMVILDDALAYADAERLERMFDIMAHAAAKVQILVLTCREDLFRRLGAARLELRAAGG